MAAYHVLIQIEVAQKAIVRERLIEAPTKAAAIRHAAQDSITAEVATIEDIMRLAKDGVTLEKVAE